VSRPLAGGWLGLAAGGRSDTTIILIDRSPSMQQSGADARGSKLETGVRQLVQTLETLGSGRWVLIDSATKKPRELEKVSELLTATSTDRPAHRPTFRDAARGAQLHQANKVGRTEIWICSDLRENDWNSTGGRWQVCVTGWESSANRANPLARVSRRGQGKPGNPRDRRPPPQNQRRAELLLSLKVTRQRQPTTWSPSRFRSSSTAPGRK